MGSLISPPKSTPPPMPAPVPVPKASSAFDNSAALTEEMRRKRAGRQSTFLTPGVNNTATAPASQGTAFLG